MRDITVAHMCLQAGGAHVCASVWRTRVCKRVRV
uniref:Uncharacterized protein n=1 Tax=Anguilla anguilla TaxID=7936 RepID=A0A0E9PV31_ANGAN